MKHIKTAAIMLGLFTLLTGVIYPLATTLIAGLLFPAQARGDSADLIGQDFSDPKYFWGRPSATGPVAYNAAASSGANWGPTNKKLVDAATARVETLRKADPGNSGPIPVDLVSASGSGLDPHISPAGARFQAARVARARGLTVAQVEELIARHIEGRQLGILGEPRVNVLQLNRELESQGSSSSESAPADNQLNGGAPP